MLRKTNATLAGRGLRVVMGRMVAMATSTMIVNMNHLPSRNCSGCRFRVRIGLNSDRSNDQWICWFDQIFCLHWSVISTCGVRSKVLNKLHKERTVLASNMKIHRRIRVICSRHWFDGDHCTHMRILTWMENCKISIQKVEKNRVVDYSRYWRGVWLGLRIRILRRLSMAIRLRCSSTKIPHHLGNVLINVDPRKDRGVLDNSFCTRFAAVSRGVGGL